MLTPRKSDLPELSDDLDKLGEEITDDLVHHYPNMLRGKVAVKLILSKGFKIIKKEDYNALLGLFNQIFEDDGEGYTVKDMDDAAEEEAEDRA